MKQKMQKKESLMNKQNKGNKANKEKYIINVFQFSAKPKKLLLNNLKRFLQVLEF